VEPLFALRLARIQQFRWIVWVLLMVVVALRLLLIPRLPHTPVWLVHASSCLLWAFCLLQGWGLWLLQKERADEPKVKGDH
jgi:hypothetical protein